MRFRTARCGDSLHAHGPHTFTEYEFGGALGFDVACPGWPEGDAAASAVVAALRAHGGQAGAWLECGWRAAADLTALMEPDLADMRDPAVLTGRVDRLFGVEVRLAEGDPAGWRLMTAAGQLAEGQVPQ